MADDIASLQIRVLSQDVEAANRRLAELERQGRGAEKSVGKLGATSKVSFGTIASGVAGIAGVGAATGAAVNEWLKYDSAMKEVMSISSMTRQEFQTMRSDVLALASAMGVDATVAAKGLYQALSAGVPKENAFKFLEAASKAAIGGVTSVDVAVNALTNVINAYKLPVAEAEAISDKLFSAVVGGKVTFEELSTNMSKATVVAAAMGVPLDQVLGAVVAITSQGTPAAESFTQIKEALTSLLNPSDQMIIAFDSMGVTSGRQAIEMHGLAGALQLVRDRFEGQDGVLVQAMRSTEAYNGMLSMTGENLKLYNKGLKDSETSLGMTAKAATENANTLGNALTGLKATFVGFVESLETGYAPIRTVTGLLKEMTSALAYAQNAGNEAVTAATKTGGIIGVQTLQNEIARLEALKAQLDVRQKRGDWTTSKGAENGGFGDGSFWTSGTKPIGWAVSDTAEKLAKAKAALAAFNEETIRSADLMTALNDAVKDGNVQGAEAIRGMIDAQGALARGAAEQAQIDADRAEEDKAARLEKVAVAEKQLAYEKELAETKKKSDEATQKNLDGIASEAERLATTERESLELQIKKLEVLKEQRPEMARTADEAIAAVRAQLAEYDKTHTADGSAIKKALAVDEEALGRSLDKQKEMRLEHAEEVAQSEYEIALAAQEKLARAIQESMIGRHQYTISAFNDFFGNLASLTNSHSEKAFKVGQAFAIAQATVQMFQSAVGAYAQGSAISPFLGPVFAAAALAAGAGNIANIKSQQFQAYEHGGMIPAGAVGLVGEAGPEFVRGPAVVTSARATNGIRSGKDDTSKGVTVIVNNTPGHTAEVTTRDTPDGTLVEIAITKTIDRLTAEATNGGGKFVPALASRFNMRRNGNSK